MKRRLILLLCSAALAVHALDLKFTWSPNTEADLAGYDLVVGRAGETNAWATVSVTTNLAHVAGVPAGEYWAYVRARSTHGLVSEPSDLLVFSVPRAPANVSVSILIPLLP